MSWASACVVCPACHMSGHTVVQCPVGRGACADGLLARILQTPKPDSAKPSAPGTIGAPQSAPKIEERREQRAPEAGEGLRTEYVPRPAGALAKLYELRREAREAKARLAQLKLDKKIAKKQHKKLRKQIHQLEAQL